VAFQGYSDKRLVEKARERERERERNRQETVKSRECEGTRGLKKRDESWAMQIGLWDRQARARNIDLYIC